MNKRWQDYFRNVAFLWLFFVLTQLLFGLGRRDPYLEYLPFALFVLSLLGYVFFRFKS
jgi:hypothetical protein